MSEYRTAWEVFMRDCDAMDEHTHVRDDHERIRALEAALDGLVGWAEAQECYHEETERRGVIWEVCLSCGRQYADDEGGIQPYTIKALSAARAALQRPQDQAQPKGDDRPHGQADG